MPNSPFVPDPESPLKPQRRPRYKGKNPRDFSHKYKEHRKDAETLEKVMASGKTPAGTHRPIMVEEILEALEIGEGSVVVDCTLGYGGHAAEILKKILPSGKLAGLDRDPLELGKTRQRLLSLEGVEEERNFFPRHTNYAGISKVVQEIAPEGVDAVLADLGLSSMQIDNPERGFSYKTNGPLDMRMNPEKGIGARDLLKRTSVEKVARWLAEYSDEPFAEPVAAVIAGKEYATTSLLAADIRKVVPEWSLKDSLARIFQAIRIAVNDEYASLDAFLRVLPLVLKPGGRAVLLTFHSGEDRRVKHAFKKGLENGDWCRISEEVVRSTPEEIRNNPRASSAKLRWAIKS